MPLLRLIDHLKGNDAISRIPNLVYRREDNKIIENPREDYPIEDIPLPDFDGLPLEAYRIKQDTNNLVLPYQISKGCLNRCSFCTFPAVSRKLAFKSNDKVVNDLAQMKKKYQSRIFFFCDELINNSYDRLEELCDLFIKNKLDILWSAHAKVGNLDKRILKKMREAGCFRLAFGIESGSNKILESMNKGFTAEQAGNTLKDAFEAGINVRISLINGYPHEKNDDVKKTLDFIRKNRKYISYAWVYKFSLNYGSAIYLHPERYGVKNLIAENRDFCFRFDETSGLKWKQRKRQQRYNHMRTLQAVYGNLAFNRKHRLLLFCFISAFYFITVKLKKAYSFISIKLKRTYFFIVKPK
ncbi:MAG: radical SAM protein [Candidatus Omnitrophica bacterium]|nr:radical SAM protein [Candidatus Omnitrophota bacterium]MBU1923209.1 radical SAM protein [Candidatus Omnitrophota bacterium]